MKRLLIAVAIPEEFQIVASVLGALEKFPVEILKTGMGPKSAAKAAQDKFDPARHGGLLVLGYCGGLSPLLKLGDTVIASQVLDKGAQKKILLDEVLTEKLCRGVVSLGFVSKSVSMITQGKVVETPSEKKSLFELTRAEAVDMESFSLVDEAQRKDIRAAVMKTVMDDATTQTPKYNDVAILKLMKRADEILRLCLRPAVEILCEHWDIN
jgi:nucleoside phosphorylase